MMSASAARFLLIEAASGNPRSAHSDAAGVERILIPRDGVAVENDTDEIKDSRPLIARQI